MQILRGTARRGDGVRAFSANLANPRECSCHCEERFLRLRGTKQSNPQFTVGDCFAKSARNDIREDSRDSRKKILGCTLEEIAVEES